MSARESQHDDQNGALRADLPVGRNAHEDEERAGERQSERAEHGAEGRHAAADEFAAAQDDAGDGIERVAIGDMGIGRGGEADKREAGQHAEESRPAHTSPSWS